jgi:hypothetical protein
MRIFYVLILLLFACSPLRQYNSTGFTTEGHTIFFEGREIAKLSNIEYSLDGNRIVKEFTFKLKNQSDGHKVKDLLKFINETHKGWEIEIDLPISDSIQFEK